MDVEEDTVDVGHFDDMYLHNYGADALGADMPSVRVIGVSTLFATHQTDPIHLMWSFWFICAAAFGCQTFPQAKTFLIGQKYISPQRFSRHEISDHIFILNSIC